MKKLGILIMLGTLFLSPGCYAEITGTVVDAESGEPIEGAVILVEWTVTKGLPGLNYTESFKVVEAVSDKNGKVKIADGVYDISVAPPDVTVYKKGYVAWNDRYVFPDYKKRKDFEWKDGYVFRLEKFKAEYSYHKHVLFINGAIHSGMASEQKLLINDATQWEEFKAMQERHGK